MSSELLGAQFDIHGGGADLQFPHHENEIAQSEGAHFHDVPGRFANYWIHNGFVRVEVDLLVDADVAAADMASRDGSSPIMPQDLAPEDLPAGDPEKVQKKRR
jgi:hypothetical protein